MGILSRPLPLGDVDDLERVVRRALDDYLSSRGAHLGHPAFDYEDALQSLFEISLELWRDFDGTQSASFKQFLNWLLRRRITDLLRQEHEDWRYAPVEFGSKVLQRARLAAGLQLEDIAGELEVDVSACKRWERTGLVPQVRARELAGMLELDVPDARRTSSDYWDDLPERRQGVDESHWLAGVISEVNREALMPASRKTFELVLRPIVETGATLDEIAEDLGWKRRRVSKELNELRQEPEIVRAREAACERSRRASLASSTSAPAAARSAA